MPRRDEHRFRAVVIGVSTGGISALKGLLSALPANFPLPIIIVCHMAPIADDGVAILLDSHSAIRVKEADEGELLSPATVYLAPANYHLLVEKSGQLALSVDPPLHFARPAVDILFESAADAFGPALIGIILTGVGCDGSQGLRKIQECGGVTIVQDPADAEADSMPQSALNLIDADHVLSLPEIPPLLLKLLQEMP